MSSGKKQKSGAMLGIILVLVYAGVLLGTLIYTGVINFPAEKKTNVAKEKTDKTDKSGSTTTTTAAETGSNATTTTSITTTTSTTIADPETGDDTSLARLKRLVKIYEAMDAGQAAEIMSKLTDSEAVSILSVMDEEIAAEVLSAMDADRAATLSKKIGLQ